jgi:hypothetical protein
MKEKGCSPMMYNWNRMAMLSSMDSISARNELSFRINLQNAFSCAKSDDERVRILDIADKSLTHSQKLAIDAMMKKRGVI